MPARTTIAQFLGRKLLIVVRCYRTKTGCIGLLRKLFVDPGSFGSNARCGSSPAEVAANKEQPTSDHSHLQGSAAVSSGRLGAPQRLREAGLMRYYCGGRSSAESHSYTRWRCRVSRCCRERNTTAHVAMDSWRSSGDRWGGLW